MPDNKIPARIHDHGLRYRSKPTGSPFSTSPGGTISCFVCGAHRPRAQLRSFKLAGMSQYRCVENCRS
ncbi:MAG: hypothetical protein Q7T63_10830 [Burkholderiaceae bacterium]|nr:hypothetical protein [Burkholderiaceae bacterium]MDP3138372.1 hypothetical protein [Burkholderiaceae bacterium]